MRPQRWIRESFWAGPTTASTTGRAQNATGSGNASVVQPQLRFSGNNNNVDGWSYDDAGNVLNDGRNSRVASSTGWESVEEAL